ncbi:MAG: SDR family NAD(P)-dependent oxidoreductase [Acidimicrobiia bacterium]
MDLGFEGKRILIAGAGVRPPRPGFGRVAALKLAAEGARIACLDFDQERADAVTAEVRDAGCKDAISIVADMTKREDVQRAVNETVAAFGGLDVTINIIGGARWGRAWEFEDADWEWTMDTNLWQNYLLFQEAAKYMIQQGTGGSMIAVVSVDGLNSSKLHVAYGAAKAGLISTIKTFGEELGKFGIRVNGVAPGSVGTGNEGPGESEFGDDPLSPLAKPRTRDISNAIIFFASNLSERVTGQTLPVDGGATTKAPLMYSEDTLAWSKQFSGGGLAPDAKRP